MDKCSISIIMPVYNRETFIGDAIEAIRNQSVKDWELILVDDCSTDRSFEICEKFAAEDRRIKSYRLEENSGEPVARDFGNKKALGDVLIISDSDDLCYPNRLEVVRDYFTAHPETDAFYTNIDLFNVETKDLKRRFFQPYNKELLRNINYIPNPGSSYRKDSYFKVSGYDSEQRISCDYDLWLQFADQDMVFGYSDTSTVRMTMHPGSIRVEQQEKHKMYLDRVRAKHGITKSNLEKVKKLANEETYGFFSQPSKLELWFDIKSN